MVSESVRGMSYRGSPHFLQQWLHRTQLSVNESTRLLLMVALIGCATIWGITVMGVAHAQTAASPPYISPPVEPLQVKLPRPLAGLAPLNSDEPIVTVPQGEPCRPSHHRRHRSWCYERRHRAV
jgi:hypothetical protein